MEVMRAPYQACLAKRNVVKNGDVPDVPRKFLRTFAIFPEIVLAATLSLYKEGQNTLQRRQRLFANYSVQSPPIPTNPRHTRLDALPPRPQDNQLTTEPHSGWPVRRPRFL